jgi:carbamoyltransferase
MLGGIQTRNRAGDTPFLVRTNSAGFRTGNFTMEKPPGVRRILFYGDSFTEGVGVSDGRRFSDLIEQMIPHTEALNFGVRATGTDQQLLFFRERPPELDHDLVVIGLYTGDVKRNASKYGVLTSATGASYQKPYFVVENGELSLKNVPVPAAPAEYSDLDRSERSAVYNSGLAYRLRVLVRSYTPWAKVMLQRVIRYQPAPFLASADHPAWLLTRAILDQWVAEADVPVVVLAIPPYQYVEGTASSRAYRQRFAELASLPGLTVHDPLDDMKAAARTKGADGLRIPGDAHFSAAGHEVLARSVAPVIAEVLGPVGATAGRGPM